MERKTYTVAQLIEKLKEMPQEALVLCTGVPDGYRALDFIELFDNDDIRRTILQQSVKDPDITEHDGPYVYLDCMFNLFP